MYNSDYFANLQTSEKDNLDPQQMQLSTDNLRATKTNIVFINILYHLQPMYNRYINCI